MTTPDLTYKEAQTLLAHYQQTDQHEKAEELEAQIDHRLEQAIEQQNATMDVLNSGGIQ